MTDQTKALLLAARPKTLPAAVCPVIAGSALAWHLEHTFSWLLAVATLLSTLAIQIATNYFNDAVDSAKGADTAARLGPLRATAAGLVSRRKMLLAGAIAGLVAAAFSIPLIMERGWPILVIGALSLFFSYGYTGGPWPLAYRGLGELFVMIFFGLVAVTGTYFVHTGHWRAEALLLGVQIGALSTALIAINNLRDIEEDTSTGKRTLAVRWGKRAARILISACFALPYVITVLFLLVGSVTILMDGAMTPRVFRPDEYSIFYRQHGMLMLGIMALLIADRIWVTEPSAKYNKYLALSGLHLLLWTAAFTSLCLK